MRKKMILAALALLLGAALAGCAGEQDVRAALSPRLAAEVTVVNGAATFSGARDNYTISKTDAGYTVTDKTGADATASLPGTTQRLQFTDVSVNLTVLAKARTLATADLRLLIELYIGYFNRVPDADGLSYWIDQVNAGTSFDAIGESFYDAALANAETTGYTASMTAKDFVRIIYKNVLGRDQPDEEGLNYWSGGLQSGAFTRGTILRRLLGSAHSFKGDATYGWVADLLDNKRAVGAYYAVEQGITYHQPAQSISQGKAIAALVTPTDILAAKKAGPLKSVQCSVGGCPIPVQKSSYLNAKNTGLPPLTLPNHWGVPHPIDYVEDTEHLTSGFAVADFFQEGEYSIVAFTSNFVPVNDPRYGKLAGRAYFFSRNKAGHWVNRTAEILQDQSGCITPRKVIVADFNGDGKPDVFAACHGYDQIAPPPGEENGEPYRVLLSQPDGSYKNAAGLKCYCHAAAAVDFGGKGYADIAVVDPAVHKQPYFLVNQGDGSFKPDYRRMPASTAPVCDGACGLQIASIELIDFDGAGKHDLVLMGNEFVIPNIAPSHWFTTIHKNPGTNNFTNAQVIQLPVLNDSDDALHNPLDIAFMDGAIYLSRVNGPYTKYGIQKIDYKTLSSAIIYTNSTPYPNGSVWIDWIVPYQGRIVSPNAVYPLSVR